MAFILVVDILQYKIKKAFSYLKAFYEVVDCLFEKSNLSLTPRMDLQPPYNGCYI
jgi:hypothetical protein